MNMPQVSPPDDVANRQRRVVAAALRAAYAWTARDDYPDVMKEIARMTGVIMEATGPGRSRTAPMSLVDALHRPLGELLTFVDDIDPAVADLVLLDGDGQLTPEGYGAAAEHAELLTTQGETAEWLPTWTRMRREEVEHYTFKRLIESGDPDAYVRARRALVEYPAGDHATIAAELNKQQTRPATEYRPIPAHQAYRADSGMWWWPCPVCGWPMSVRGSTVRCLYSPHAAIYTIQPASGPRARPQLIAHHAVRSKRPTARPVEAAVCVDVAVWRHIVVPGRTELRIHQQLANTGADVRLWPDWDLVDLRVMDGDTAFLELDVKEYTSTRGLIEKLRSASPRGEVLIPRTHEHQVPELQQQLPGIPVTTEANVRRRLTRFLRRTS